MYPNKNVSFRVEEGLTQVRKHSGSVWSLCFIEVEEDHTQFWICVRVTVLH